MKRLLQKQIGKTVIFCSIEDTKKSIKMENRGVMVEIEQFEPEYAKLLVDGEVVRVHQSQIIRTE